MCHEIWVISYTFETRYNFYNIYKNIFRKYITFESQDMVQIEHLQQKPNKLNEFVHEWIFLFLFYSVEIFREPDVSLGISIVGGQTVIKRLKNGEELKGIFIKQVLEDSPAGKTNALKTGDKILEVNDVKILFSFGTYSKTVK